MLAPSCDLEPCQALEWEKELLGVYMSAHPLIDVLEAARRSPEGHGLSEIAHLEHRDVNSSVRLLAMVAGIRRITTKSDRTMAVVTLEDLSGRTDLVLFPDAFDRFGSLLADGSILDVRGRLERRGDSLQIICESISRDLPAPAAPPDDLDVVLVRFASSTDPWLEIHSMQRVDEILRRHEGCNPVILEIRLARGATRQLRSRSRLVEWSADLNLELCSTQGVLGAELIGTQPRQLAS
jgi:DNA polymerase-3 subunit alpha